MRIYFGFIYLLLFLSISSKIYAKCNFKTGEFIGKIDDPRNIEFISVKIPKINKFNLDFAKIITKGETISPKFKKKYSADIIIKYSFGSCKYKGKVRQHGDGQDHVRLIDGQPLRSLDISLKTGNIINAVKFKLLIPDTRNDKNEILGSLILNELGFISPESFQVNTKINGLEYLMLFQEKTNKELLERNLKREAPLFEGDETLLWSYKEFKKMELENISLARLTNPNWAKKGSNSEKISLLAFQRIQKAYFQYISHYLNTDKVLFPNQNNNQKFVNYYLILESMNGSHALRPHNRKFYFNVFTDEFEPIYYDGGLKLTKPINLNHNYIYTDLQKTFVNECLKILSNPKNIKKLNLKYNQRIKDTNKKDFFKKSINQIKINLDKINKFIDKKNKIIINKPSTKYDRDLFALNHKKYDLNQHLIEYIVKDANDYKIQIVNLLNNKIENKTISNLELIKILSENIFENNRTIYFPLENVQKKFISEIYQIKNKSFLGGNIIYSKNILINIIEDKKEIEIEQKSPKDWILFSNIILNNWKINFKGEYNPNNYPLIQNINHYGMTGCVNFYMTEFKNTSLVLKNGKCEDTLNIVNSIGEIKSIKINSAFSDALDIDFSDIVLNEVIIDYAGNDCLDFSSGNYIVKKSLLSNCNDKAISIGEKSKVNIESSVIKDSSIGISIKDFSFSDIKYLETEKVNICIDVKQKKQEFGGSKAELGIIKCDGKINNDENSIIFQNELS